MENNTAEKSSIGIKAAILAISVVQMGTNAISPILSDLAESFPQAGSSSIQLLMTFPSMFVIVFSLITANLARTVPKKQIAALGCGLFSASGVLSWLVHPNLYVLFAWAGLMGIGIGLVVPMATSLVTDCFSGAEQKLVMGWQSSAANIGAMLMTFAGGLLAAVHWSCNYLVYLVALPGLVLALLCLPRSAGAVQEQDAVSEKRMGYFALLRRGSIAGACLLSLAVTMLFNTAPTNLSMYIAEKHLGSAAQAGTATSVLLFSGTIGGLCFGWLARRLGRYVMVFGFCMLAIGQTMCALAPSMLVVFLGCMVCGCAISTVMPQVMLDAAEASGGNPAASAALVMSASNMGGFCAPAITVIAKAVTGQSTVAPRFFLSAGFGLMLAVVLAVFLLRTSRKRSGS